jgi:heme-degrading monooxygenase HmoA
VLYILWRFRAKPDKVEEFQRRYAGDGDWAKLFAQAPGFQATDLLADTSDPLAFVVIDRWTTRGAYERFREQYGAEYEALDNQCRELTEEETAIGYYSDKPQQ